MRASSSSSLSLKRLQLLPAAAAALFFVMVCLVEGVSAVGCGEYYLNADDRCTDPQCSRTVTASGKYCVRGFAEGEACLTNDDCYIHLVCNTTASNPTAGGVCVKGSDDKVAWAGYTAVAVAVVAFGSYLIPARRVEPGNSLFFQFCEASGIIVVGFAVQMWRENVTFYPYAMIGGMLWCLGNTLAVPALKMISMGLAVSIWGASNMLLGWASGRFGIWGIDKEELEIEWLSYVGVGLAGLGIIVLACVKKSSGPARSVGGVDEYTDLSRRESGYNSVTNVSPFAQVELQQKEDISDYLSKTQMRILGIALAFIAGCFFGLNFDPPTYLANNFAHRSLVENVKYSPDALDYAFSHFFGILCTAMMLLVIFSACDTIFNLPTLFHSNPYPELILPGFVTGIGWGIGQTAWFIANNNLGLVVSFPIIALGPSMLASLWSVVLFREIRGALNYGLLIAAFVLLALSAGCTVVAKNGW